MPRGAFPECCSQCPRPLVSPCQPAPPEETLEHQQVVLAQSPVGSLLLSSVSWCTQGSVCALQDWRLCFPQSCGSLVIKSHWPSRSDSLGIPSPFVRSPGWEAWRGFRTFTTAGKLLWYYCHPVYESPTGWVWNFILSWLCPSYCLTAASFLFLDMGYLLFGKFQCLCGCSTTSCDFGAVAGESEHSFLLCHLEPQNFLKRL